jgi:hypothetical protein
LIWVVVVFVATGGWHTREDLSLLCLRVWILVLILILK